MVSESLAYEAGSRRSARQNPSCIRMGVFVLSAIMWSYGAAQADADRRVLTVTDSMTPFMIGVQDFGNMAVLPVPDSDLPQDGQSGTGSPDPGAVLSSPDPETHHLPVIRRSLSLTSGDEEQYRIALAPRRVGSTIKRQDINEYFVDPPETKGETLNLRDVIQYTLKNSPEIAIARFQADDAHHAIRSARAPLRPQVDLAGASGIEGVRFEGKPRVSLLQRSEASIRVSQTLLDFGRGQQAVKRAKSLYQSQLLRSDDVTDDVVFSAVTAYLNLLGAEQLVASSEKNVRAHERIAALVDKSYRAGNLSEAETKRAQTRLDRARTNAIDFENARERAMNEFRRATGLDPTSLVEPDLDTEAAYALTEATVDKFLQDNPALQAALRDINSLEHQIKGVSRTNLPEISMQVAGALKENVLGNETWTNDARAMVAATWTAYDGGAANARKRQLLARKREAEATLQKVRIELRQDARNIISVLTTSRDKRNIFEEQVESSERVVELYEKQFEAGRRSLLELLDAQADLASAREENIATKYENLAAAIGSLRVQNKLIPSLVEQLNLPLPE